MSRRQSKEVGKAVAMILKKPELSCAQAAAKCGVNVSSVQRALVKLGMARPVGQPKKVKAQP